MNTPIKIIIPTLAVAVGLIVYNGLTAPTAKADNSSQTAGATLSSTLESTSQVTNSDPAAQNGGWASSPSVFVARWNRLAASPHELSPFEISDKGTIALFDGGSVHYFSPSPALNGAYTVDPYDRSASVSTCALGYAAATGSTYQIGSQMAHAALADYLANPNPMGGSALRDGHMVSFSVQGNGSVDCAIFRTAGH
jgi:hypothetical protein